MVGTGGHGRPFPFSRLNPPDGLPITRVMSIATTLERVNEIRQALVDPGALVSRTGGAEAPDASSPAGEGSFASALRQAGEGAGATGSPGASTGSPTEAASASSADGVVGLDYQPTGVEGVGGLYSGGLGGAGGNRVVAVAESQLGETEQPPGSNESPAIAEYRSATAGAVPGAPWCAYFASWAAREAGEPLGATGQGIGDVADIWSWAQSTGRAISNGPGVVPKAGDLIVFGDSHVGIVRGVLPDGSIATIEGNYENKVAANVRSPGEATGYVELG